MITNFIISMMIYPMNWALGFFPGIETANLNSAVGNITTAIDYITNYMAIAMYVFPFYITLMDIFGLWLLYSMAKFTINIITWIASSTPFSPVQRLDL